MQDHLVAVEIGGTKLQVVLGDTAGNILRRERGSVTPEEGANGILTWIDGAIERVLDGDNAVAMGVGFGGPVENATGRALTSHQVAGWDGVQLKGRFEDRFRLPTIIENDANAAGWAEYRLGAGQGTRNFVYCNIGSGIGGAFIARGQLYNGQGLGGCEIGHTYIADWTAPSAGAVDKLEHLCSGWSITRRIRAWESVAPDTPLGALCKGGPKALTCPMLAEAARGGDPRALDEIHAIARGVGQALTNVITLLHPERIAMGGGVSLMGDVLLDPLRAYIDANAFGPYRGTVELVPCALEEDVVTAGALLLAAEATKP